MRGVVLLIEDVSPRRLYSLASEKCPVAVLARLSPGELWNPYYGDLAEIIDCERVWPWEFVRSAVVLYILAVGQVASLACGWCTTPSASLARESVARVIDTARRCGGDSVAESIASVLSWHLRVSSETLGRLREGLARTAAEAWELVPGRIADLIGGAARLVEEAVEDASEMPLPSQFNVGESWNVLERARTFFAKLERAENALSEANVLLAEKTGS